MDIRAGKAHCRGRITRPCIFVCRYSSSVAKEETLFLGDKTMRASRPVRGSFFSEEEKGRKDKNTGWRKENKRKAEGQWDNGARKGEREKKEMPQRRKINAVKAENAGKGRRGWQKGHGRNDDIVVTWGNRGVNEKHERGMLRFQKRFVNSQTVWNYWPLGGYHNSAIISVSC